MASLGGLRRGFSRVQGQDSAWAGHGLQRTVTCVPTDLVAVMASLVTNLTLRLCFASSSACNLNLIHPLICCDMQVRPWRRRCPPCPMLLEPRTSAIGQLYRWCPLKCRASMPGPRFHIPRIHTGSACYIHDLCSAAMASRSAWQNDPAFYQPCRCHEMAPYLVLQPTSALESPHLRASGCSKAGCAIGGSGMLECCCCSCS